MLGVLKAREPFTRIVSSLIAIIGLTTSSSQLDASPSLRARPAIELSWENPTQKTDISISADGETWTAIIPTRHDGTRSYWITTLDQQPRFARTEPTSLPKGDQLVVTLPEAVRQLRIEILNEQTQQWEVQILAQLEGKAGQYSFDLDKEQDVSNIRISANESALFSFPFQSNRSVFEPVEDSNSINVFGYLDGAPEARAGVDDTSTTTVEESDIWRIHGDRLFFFNQRRGLQVIDLSDRDAPEVTHSLKMPSAGQEMYSPTSDTAILLTRAGHLQNSSLHAISIDGDSIITTSVTEIQGNVYDSRLVGNMLYTVSNDYELIEENGYSYYGSRKILVSAIDFSDHAAPVIVKEVSIPDYNAILTATPEYLIVASHSWRSRSNNTSDIFLFDIADSDEPLKPVQALTTEGRIQDKFKIGINDRFITAISQTWNRSEAIRTETIIETFDLNPSEAPIELPGNSDDEQPEEADPIDSDRLGRLQVIENESLFATHILDDMAYVVTFERVDPLWVIDLSDPTKPNISGELEIPGWSTYIKPIGDYLFSVGIEDGRVALSMFNVADPSNPSLNSRVYLGDEDSRSWSEANYDEKAISILPEQNLALIPFTSYGNGIFGKTSLQLVEFEDGILTLRGTIENNYLPRRATTLGDSIVSVSENEVLLYDMENLDAPGLQSRLELAWTVNHLLAHKEHLLQVESNANNYYYILGANNEAKPRIRVTHQNDTDTILDTIEIGTGSLVGIAQQNDHLYALLITPPNEEEEQAEHILELKTYDMSTPLDITLISTLSIGPTAYPNNLYTPKWADNATLIWHSHNTYYNWGRYLDIWNGYYPGDQGRVQFYAFDHSNPDSPELASELEIEPDRTTLDPNEDETLIPSYRSQSLTNPIYSNQRYYIGESLTEYLINRSETAHSLIEVDFTNPTEPIVNNNISIPGRLQHVYENDQGGILLFTKSQSEVNTTETYYTVPTLQASVYFESKAFFVDDIEFDPQGSYDFKYHDKTAFARIWPSYNYRIANPEIVEQERQTISRIHFNESGAFELLDAIVLDDQISAFDIIEENLFVLKQTSYNQPKPLQIIDPTDLSETPAALEIELFPINHNLSSLTINDNSLLFALDYYGAFTYAFEPFGNTAQSIVDSGNLRTFAASPINSRQDWLALNERSQPVTINGSSSNHNATWILSDSNTLSTRITEELQLIAPLQQVATFKIEPAIEYSLQTDAGKTYALKESNDLISWTSRETITGDGTEKRFPAALGEEANLFLKAEEE